ncbi:MAG: bile acid:sodium symporter family protein [Gammaproteobacteria bacterium]|nr:bile acid:sodium symporter family protein [Gammaproteobacteria bacterium]
MTSLHRFAMWASLVLLVAATTLFAVGRPQIAGPVLVVLFALAAFGVRGNEKLRGISFSLLIFAAVSFALCWPAPLVSWGEFQLSALIVPLLQIIMFGMGTAMSARDFVGIVKSPKAVFIGLACQFTLMPFVGAGLASAFDFGPEVAAGIILIGAAPSGLASNVMAYIGKANLALSVTLTSVATLLAPFITPFYMQWLAGQYVPIDTWGMMWSIIQITILPIVAGLIFNHFLHGRTGWLDRLMPKVSMLGIALILMIMTAGGRDNLLEIGLMLIVVALLHNVAGYLLGYWSCRALRLDEKSCRTIAFEVGLQNAGLATGLAQTMGKMATVGLVPTVFGSLMNVTGAALATWWRDRPTGDDERLGPEPLSEPAFHSKKGTPSGA